jgi:hypothetical protein
VTTLEKSSASVKQSAKAKKRWNGVGQKERSRTMARVAHERWSGITQTEDEIRKYFESADLDAALETYAVMRKQYEQAGKLIDHRVQTERNTEACENCGTRFDKDKVWYNREPVKDPETGIMRNIFSCSQACMIALKGKATGIKQARRA